MRAFGERMRRRLRRRRRPVGRRESVGVPESADVIAAMSFSLLAALGLRSHHRLLDIGCGPLRVGRLLIPYLEAGNYVGIEPNERLLDRGVREQLGRDLVRIKRPRLVVGAEASALGDEEPFDFAIAQSIFSHTGEDLLTGWLAGAASVLGERGALVATFVPGEVPPPDGWTEGAVMHRPSRMAELAAAVGLSFELLDWRHPAQTWALFAKPDWDASPLGGTNEPNWNRFLDDALARGTVPGQPLDRRFGSTEG